MVNHSVGEVHPHYPGHPDRHYSQDSCADLSGEWEFQPQHGISQPQIHRWDEPGGNYVQDHQSRHDQHLLGHIIRDARGLAHFVPCEFARGISHEEISVFQLTSLVKPVVLINFGERFAQYSFYADEKYYGNNLVVRYGPSGIPEIEDSAYCFTQKFLYAQLREWIHQGRCIENVLFSHTDRNGKRLINYEVIISIITVYLIAYLLVSSLCPVPIARPSDVIVATRIRKIIYYTLKRFFRENKLDFFVSLDDISIPDNVVCAGITIPEFPGYVEPDSFLYGFNGVGQDVHLLELIIKVLAFQLVTQCSDEVVATRYRAYGVQYKHVQSWKRGYIQIAEVFLKVFPQDMLENFFNSPVKGLRSISV